MPPTNHATLGASSAYRWMNCPGSIRLSAGIAGKTSIYAQEGTAAHYLAETCLQRGDNAAKYLGWHVGQNENEVGFLMEQRPSSDKGLIIFEVSEEMAEAVQVYLSAIREDQAGLPDAALKIEQKFDLSELHPGMFGTNDACLVESFGKLIVYDYKHGAGKVVEVENNPQLLYYALGASRGEFCEEVELVVVQPRARHKDGPVRRWALSLKELNNWAENELLAAARRTVAPDAPVISGEWCTFCPVLDTCPAFLNRAMEITKSDFQTIPLPDPGLLTEADLIKVLNSGDLLKTWLSRVYAFAESKLREGGSIPGWKLVQKKTNRRWKDEQSVVDFFSKGRNAKKVKIYDQKLRSPAQLENAIETLGLAIKIDHLWEKPDGGLTMAPESDRRAAVAVAPVADDFDVITVRK